MRENASISDMRLRLRVIDTPVEEDLGRQIVLASVPVLIGRARDTHLQLGDGAVSRHHVRAELAAGEVHLADLGSNNGLWVRDELLTEVVLGPGETFRIGATLLAVEPADAGVADLRGPEPSAWLAVAAGAGEPVPVAGNRHVFLDDPAAVWWVEQGSVDVFGDSFRDGRPEGEPVYVGSFQRGSFLFGAAPVASGAVVSGFLVKGQPGTLLRRLDRTLLETWSADPSRVLAVTAAMSAWMGVMRKKAGRDATRSGSVTDATQVLRAPDVRDLWPVLDGLAEAVLRATDETRRARSMEALEYQRLRSEEVRRRERQAGEVLESVGAPDDAAERRPLDPGASDLLLQTARSVARVAGIDLRIDPADVSSQTGRSFEEAVAALSDAARVRIRKVALRGDWWRHDQGPLLARRKDGSPVALLPAILRWPGRSYVLLDRRAGTRVRLTESLAEELEPFAFMFYRPLPEGPVRSLRQLLPFVSSRLGWDVLQLVLAGMGIGLLGSAIPLITGWFIDEAVTAADRSLLVQCVLGLLVVSIASPLLKLFENLLALRLEGRVDLALQAAVWDRLLSLPAAFFRRYEAGDLEERANAVYRMRSLLARSGRIAILGLVSSLFYLVLMFGYSTRLAVYGVGTAALLVGASFLMAVGQLQQQRKLAEREGEVAATLLQLISGIGKIRVAAAESYALYVWVEKFARQLDATVRAGRWQNWAATFQSVFPVVGPMVLFLFAIPEESSQEKSLSTGQFVAFLTAYGLFSTAVLSLGDMASKLSEVVPIYRRLRPILEEEPETDLDKHPAGELEGAIRLSRISFRYTPDGPWILRDVDFEIRPGEMVALVGESGSGKSTLLRLLLGFERPDAGEIYFDGKQLSTLDLRSVRRQIGVVLQTSKPFAADILQNILGASGRSALDAVEAARQAGFDQDVEKMPMKWNTFVGENGANLSGGQRQRLMIARALIHRPRILFMDEATSALDNRTQSIVAESLDRLKATRVVVAHRLSTIRNADRILLMADGRIQDEGTFDDLLHRNETFARLAKRQML